MAPRNARRGLRGTEWLRVRTASPRRQCGSVARVTTMRFVLLHRSWSVPWARAASRPARPRTWRSDQQPSWMSRAARCSPDARSSSPAGGSWPWPIRPRVRARAGRRRGRRVRDAWPVGHARALRRRRRAHRGEPGTCCRSTSPTASPPCATRPATSARACSNGDARWRLGRCSARRSTRRDPSSKASIRSGRATSRWARPTRCARRSTAAGHAGRLREDHGEHAMPGAVHAGPSRGPARAGSRCRRTCRWRSRSIRCRRPGWARSSTCRICCEAGRRARQELSAAVAAGPMPAGRRRDRDDRRLRRGHGACHLRPPRLAGHGRDADAERQPHPGVSGSGHPSAATTT